MIIDKFQLNKLLLQIINDVEPKRKMKIEKFQNYIRNEEIVGITEEEMNMYNTLAYDLDFYEPNEEWRKEDPVYYDEKKLIIEISEVLKKL